MTAKPASSPRHSGPGSRDQDLDGMLARVAHWLPAQGPIKDFIHHNTLHAFQHLKFHDAVSAAARLHGATTAMSGRFYVDAYRAGRIPESALAWALEQAFPNEPERVAARARMLAEPLEQVAFAGLSRSGLRAGWAPRLGDVPLDRRSHLHLFRMLGAYLDQGLSTWRMPAVEELGFFDAVAQLAHRSRLPLGPLGSPMARALLRLGAREALAAALRRTLHGETLWEPYLLETLLAQPGWAGLVGECERKPELLLARRRIALLDYAAVTAVVELGCLEQELGADFSPLEAPPDFDAAAYHPDRAPRRTPDERLLSTWHEAFERSYYEPLLGGLAAPKRSTASVPAAAWAFFCLDDRACSLRRHIEEVAPEISTFGTAGFFGFDFMYCGAGDAIASKHCPAPVDPRHLVVESYETVDRPTGADAPWWRRPLHLDARPNTLVRGWILSYTLGIGAALRLAASVFRPSLAPVTAEPLSTVSGGARFKLVRQNDERSPEGLWLGYTFEELADRVQDLLRSVGARPPWPELVMLFGHGASSVNNPYFAAYNCGACSGRSGAPNARAFAKAANRPEVRAVLAARGLVIPESTWFIGALYDTTRDEATYYDYDVARMPARFAESFAALRRTIETASARNAAERCRRFDTVPMGISPAQALEEVRRRSISLFEPRPEYNHATNASCVVGRRQLTQGLFLDRRAFLSSYDPTLDPTGEILVATLAAVIPVCAGINLEYFFSRIDPLRYGAGTKLPHNVNGLLGVCNGIEGDLLTGLPTQMTEIHDPVRLLTVVEQTPEIALAAVRARPGTFEWLENDWIRYACIHPESRRVWIYAAGAMHPLDGLTAPSATFVSSLEAARQGRDNLPPSFIVPVERAS
ncbi:MAG TPA: putative inorganic carbon transporter subunit DabA [Polyangia bacterium]|nr:putative inorganic carbon transporter subunit DabA [Polyangia bacterium]